jgi:uncharacterized protein (TIGR02145 family)
MLEYTSPNSTSTSLLTDTWNCNFVSKFYSFINNSFKMKQVYHFLMILFIICFTTNLYSQSVPSYVPTNGLVGWWGFNGNAQDGSGNGNHGTVNGATLTTDRFGNQNAAYNFNGVNNWIQVQDHVSLRPNHITMSAWFNLANLNGSYSIIAKTNTQNASGEQYILGVDFLSNWKPNFQIKQGSNCQPGYNWQRLILNTSYSQNNWYHIVCTYDGTTLKIFQNGQINSTNLVLNGVIDNCQGGTLNFGTFWANCCFFDGKLDDIGIWNRALTPQEITNLYTSQLSTQTSLCLPSITTNTPTSIGIDSVIVGGNITNDGGSSIVLRGVCYSTTPNPNMGNMRTEDGSGVGSFSTILRNLNPSTTYYVRSYAKNSQGVVVYGNEVSFSTGTPTLGIRCPGTPSVTDIDGNIYHTVQIGTQCWTQSNLKVSKYRNGDIIPPGPGHTTWQNTIAGAYAIYNYNSLNDSLYGKLYNNYAVTDTRGLCPTGWHVPTDGEWNSLVNFLGGSGIAGGALKSTVTQPTLGGWASPNTGASNSLGFTAGPSGLRDDYGVFLGIGYYGYWWSSTLSGTNAWYCALGYDASVIYRLNSGVRNCGYSVRCLRDSVGGGTSMVIPTVTTASVTAVTSNSATTGGDVTQDGGTPVTARGVAYGTSSSPTTSGTITNDGTGTGVFTSTLAGLTPSTTYNVRAYATNSVGTAYGNEVTFTTSPLAIGSSYAGGIIFYLDSTGQHGLVCAPSDQGAGIWGCAGTDIPNTSIIVGTGATNTAYILAGCAQRPIAASVCADLVLNGYSDWYLPSLGELQLMYSRLHLQGLGGFGWDWYWSSSQYGPYSAWAMDFYGGNVVYSYGKGYNVQVRAVRSF